MTQLTTLVSVLLFSTPHCKTPRNQWLKSCARQDAAFVSVIDASSPPPANGKLAACLVLRELAKEAPSWVHLRMAEIVPQIVVAVHDGEEEV